MGLINKLFGPETHKEQWSFPDVQYTQDMATIEQFKFQLLFVPDRMMRSHPDYGLIAEHSFCLGRTFTVKPFAMYKRCLAKETYPIPLEAKGEVEAYDPFRIGEHMQVPCRIGGELHSVRPYQFFELDKYKENGVKFERKRVPLVVHHHVRTTSNELKARVTIAKAWMYVGIPEYWEPQLDAGNLFKPVRRYQARNTNLGWYTYFTPEEYRVHSSAEPPAVS